MCECEDDYFERETAEEIAKRRGAFVREESGIIEDGEFKGYTWRVVTYEKQTVFSQYIDFEIKPAPMTEIDITKYLTELDKMGTIYL